MQKHAQLTDFKETMKAVTNDGFLVSITANEDQHSL